jgi:hypothetical protein
MAEDCERGGVVVQPYFAFVGKMHSGKTTAAKMLVEQHGFTRLSFAHPVKEVSVKMVNTFLDWMEEPDTFTFEELEENKTFWRPLLQFVGTEMGRQYLYDEVWIDKFTDYFLEQRYYDPAIKVAMDDCRFVNEAKRLRKLGFTIIKLVRPEEERRRSVEDTVVKRLAGDEGQQRYGDIHFVKQVHDEMEKIFSHPSETEVDNIKADFEVESKDIDTLEKLTQMLAAGRDAAWFLNGSAGDDDHIDASELDRWYNEGGND